MIRSRLRMRGGGSGGGSPPSFAPTDISGLQLWLDAADTASITHSLNAVSQWNDKSGNLNHAAQGTAAQQPLTNTRTVNGLNVIDYPPSPFRQLSMPSTLDSIYLSANTTFLVTNTDNIALDRGYYDAAGAPSNVSMALSNNATRKARYRHGNAAVSDIAGTLDTNPHILVRSYNGATSQTGYLDGGTGVSSTAAAVTVSSVTSMGSTFGNDCFYAEVLHYNSALSTADLNRVGNYLAAKWGITWTAI